MMNQISHIAQISPLNQINASNQVNSDSGVNRSIKQESLKNMLNSTISNNPTIMDTMVGPTSSNSYPLQTPKTSTSPVSSMLPLSNAVNLNNSISNGEMPLSPSSNSNSNISIHANMNNYLNSSVPSSNFLPSNIITKLSSSNINSHPQHNYNNNIVLPPLSTPYMYNPGLNPTSSISINNSHHNSNPGSSAPAPAPSNFNSPPNNSIDFLPPLFKLSSEPINFNQNTRTKYSSTSGVTKSGNLPRKKRKCSICNNFFSNLTTHRKIHEENVKPFNCKNCDRSFKRLNDLLRHEKCHLSKLGQYEFQCPFHPGTDITNRSEICHHTGFFTRCDTYKNHLKAIHFTYPANTLKSERSNVNGHCRECDQFFPNVQDWLINHIETNSCPKMIQKYKKNE